MYSHLNKNEENQHKSISSDPVQKQGKNDYTDFVDNSPEAKQAAQLQAMADNSPETKQAAQLQAMADNSPEAKEAARLQTMADKNSEAEQPIAPNKPNNTGLPDDLKTGIENLSGYSMDNVKVHYNSDKPAQLGAHAYAQGTDIYLASGQEKHLPHEAWHVVQQMQGRVKSTIQMEGNVNINDDGGLEKEADVMGDKIRSFNTKTPNVSLLQTKLNHNFPILQRYVHYQSEGVGEEERGKVMRSGDLNINNIGVGTTPSVEIGGSEKVRHHRATQASPYCVRMHLLNEQLGGSGEDRKNLGWGSTALNGQHKNKIENKLNHSIDSHRKSRDHPNRNRNAIESYNVVVEYYRKLDDTDVEKSKAAMIQKLYYEAKFYKDINSTETDTEKGVLYDARGIAEMQNLVENEHRQDIVNGGMLNYYGTALSEVTGNDIPDLITGEGNLNLDVINYYNGNDIGYAQAAEVRTPRPPKTIEQIVSEYLYCKGYFEFAIKKGELTSIKDVLEECIKYLKDKDERIQRLVEETDVSKVAEELNTNNIDNIICVKNNLKTIKLAKENKTNRANRMTERNKNRNKNRNRSRSRSRDKTSHFTRR